MNWQLPETATNSLQTLYTHLHDHYYTILEDYCEQAFISLASLEDLDLPPSMLAYTTDLRRLTGEAERFLELRHTVLLPYVNELSDKEATGHNCRHCSTSCTIRHTARLTDIRLGHGILKDLTAKLNHFHDPELAHHPEYPVFRELTDETEEFTAFINSLLDLETSTLVPMILTSQTNIHAHD